MRAWLLVGLLLPACTEEIVQSALVENADMSTHYTVAVAADGSTTASAQYNWNDGDNHTVVLGDGDALEIDGIDVGHHDAMGIYTVDVASAASHSFILRRPATAPIEQIVTAPSPISITSTAINSTYDIVTTVTWAPFNRGATVDITARGLDGCASVGLATGRIDSGSFLFTGADVQPAAVPPPACMYSLEVTQVTPMSVELPPLSGAVIERRFTAATTMSLH